MQPLTATYRTSLGLLTDLYQLTMAYGYWKLGRAEQEAVFHLFFRRPPFQGGFALTAGLAHVVDFLDRFGIDEGDRAYLATLTGNDGKALFEPAFLDYLGQLSFTCAVDAVPEGTVVFGDEPLVRVHGPIIQSQIVETALLNLVNFQTLVATKSARICMAAGEDSVLEFGLRRAQGVDGALAATRAAYIGGASATSNVLAGRLFGIPVHGTHAHSWVMAFDEEIESFESYAATLPNNCVFLVDTYDTIAGVHKAVEVGRRLRQRGHEMVGIRLDSGDLAYLSIEARRVLDEAGFDKAVIVASNDLDEQLIRDLKQQGATVAVWGVGTKLATAYDQPALGGVYKLGAIRNADGSWKHCVKLSEQVIKTSIPGILNVRRFATRDGLIADMIYDELTGVTDATRIIDADDPERHKSIDAAAQHRDLLVPVARDGHIVMEDESLDVIRQRAAKELTALHPSIRRFLNPHEYPVGLESELHELRSRMIHDARTKTSEAS
ncbi:MAG: nicotinate phosphoribosyltransferase [Phycisphaeraceae bacterium]|nr:nicotinate phosphoribosyltransferase [Phycisphaeraceae bacterium]